MDVGRQKLDVFNLFSENSMINAKCKKCRRVGQKLFLKGERCFTVKCAMIKKPYPPGIHKKKRRRSLSEYGKQLLEKQKIRQTYGMRERQFKKYVKEIMFKKGDKRELLFRKLEKRLDNIIFRLGWAKSRAQARQLISHGHVLINVRRVTIPSYEVKISDMIAVSKKSQKLTIFEGLKTTLKKQEVPPWLSPASFEKGAGFEAKVKSEPSFGDSKDLQDLGIIIEYYSR